MEQLSVLAENLSKETGRERQRALFNQWYDGTGEREGRGYPKKKDRGRALEVFIQRIKTPRLYKALCLKTDADLKTWEDEGTATQHIPGAKTYLRNFKLEDLKDAEAIRPRETRADRLDKQESARSKTRCYACDDSGIVSKWCVLTYSTDERIGSSRRLVKIERYVKKTHKEIDRASQRIAELPTRCKKCKTTPRRKVFEV